MAVVFLRLLLHAVVLEIQYIDEVDIHQLEYFYPVGPFFMLTKFIVSAFRLDQILIEMMTSNQGEMRISLRFFYLKTSSWSRGNRQSMATVV